MNASRTLWLLLICALAVVGGCQQGITTDYGKVDLGTVSGTVKLEGQPLANHHIVFISENGTFSFGKTNTSGEYSLMFNSEKAGCTKGPKIVKIQNRRFTDRDLFPESFNSETPSDSDDEAVPGDMESINGEVESDSFEVSNGLPDVYHVDSHLQVEVTDDSQVINWDLKQDGSTTGPS